MAGNRNSGRQRRHLERARTEIKVQAVQLSWEMVVKSLNDPEYPLDKKMEIAKAIAVKTAPQEINNVIDFINDISVSMNYSKTTEEEEEDKSIDQSEPGVDEDED